MRFSTNFARTTRALVPLLSIAFVALILAAFATTIWLIVDAQSLKQQHARLATRLTQMRPQPIASAQADIANPSLPPASDLVALKRRVERINGVEAIQAKPLVNVLHELEAAMPHQVYLTQLGYRALTAETQLTAESTQVEALTTFLIRLQGNARFSEVLLTRRTQRVAQGSKRVQFELRLREKT